MGKLPTHAGFTECVSLLLQACSPGALTANTAQIWNIEEKAGSIVPGRTADLVIWDGDPLEPSTAPVMVIVQGQPVSLVTMQTLLRDRYWPTAEPGGWPPAYQ